MTTQTRLTQPEIAAKAREHEGVAQNIQNQQNFVRGSVEGVVATNQGDMVQALSTVHQQWTDACTRVRTNLLQMATNLDNAGKALQNQDINAAAQVNKIETPGLTSFLGN
ncbi:hypothetical protein GCM10011581_02840 [Saccharopolyspora subtropica]|uniref:Uncharacterized protein n=1 Tax=Saccharopolyspora thermophila TaxID=89367 RepID=A0A917N645_9PSEU|nr:WXG100 family type VII secretion target [Saccharopolyspora subtropica]GGI69273.1 hypothetical protein GCM10011581_02840 [Saccharopolyspora subtropica]